MFRFGCPFILALTIAAAGCSPSTTPAPAASAPAAKTPETPPMPKLLTWPDLVGRPRPRPH